MGIGNDVGGIRGDFPGVPPPYINHYNGNLPITGSKLGQKGGKRPITSHGLADLDEKKARLTLKSVIFQSEM